MRSFEIGEPCPNCKEPLVRMPRMFYWRGEYFDGAVCVAQNSLWPIRGEEMPPLRVRPKDEQSAT